MARDSHIPELAAHAVPAQTMATAELGWEAFRRFRSDVGLSARPLRLLAKPEPIHDLLALVPDGPPVRFRWRRAWHDVIAAEGPERIAGAWWSEKTVAARAIISRWRIERGSASGCFAQASIATCARPTPRWFLHGMYA